MEGTPTVDHEFVSSNVSLHNGGAIRGMASGLAAGAIGGASCAFALVVGFGFSLLFEQAEGATTIALRVVFYGVIASIVGAFVGGVLGTILGLILGKLKVERAASTVAAVVAALVPPLAVAVESTDPTSPGGWMLALGAARDADLRHNRLLGWQPLQALDQELECTGRCAAPRAKKPSWRLNDLPDREGGARKRKRQNRGGAAAAGASSPSRRSDELWPSCL